MDKEKTGRFIAAVRKERDMTQQDLADQIHVTGKAVSKWERGLSFPSVDILEPLAGALNVSVMDLLAGERVEKEQLSARSEEISLEVMRREKRSKKRAVLVCAVIVVVLLALFVLDGWGAAIFQRGNPIPYLTAATRISEEQPFVQVEGAGGSYVFLSERGECPALFSYVEERWGVEFVEQAGSGYVFTNGVDRLTVSAEIYWGRFTVWNIPNTTLQSPG